jgi:hypothetical protein
MKIKMDSFQWKLQNKCCGIEKHPVPEERVDQVLATLRRDDDLIDYAKMIIELHPK